MMNVSKRTVWLVLLTACPALWVFLIAVVAGVASYLG